MNHLTRLSAECNNATIAHMQQCHHAQPMCVCVCHYIFSISVEANYQETKSEATDAKKDS